MGKLVIDATNKMGKPIANARSSLASCRQASMSRSLSSRAWTPAGRRPAEGLNGLLMAPTVLPVRRLHNCDHGQGHSCRL